MKILDRYIIKTFFGPFLFIFSVLFFIFMVNIIWVQMANIFGKGLTYFQVGKVLFYMSPSVVSMVLPLTILLASIMTFGDLGERYELAALKAAGIPLSRMMASLAIPITVLAVLLYLFQNNVTPDFQKKSRNMLYNVAVSKPALNFTAGQFISQIPGYSVRFDKIYGENGQFIEGVFVHKVPNSFEDHQNIVAKRGRFAPPVDKNYIKLILKDGYVFEDNVKNLDNIQRQRQPNQSIQFDSLVLHFDVSAIINKALDEQQISDDYRFQTYREINKTIAKKKKENAEIFSGITSSSITLAGSTAAGIDDKKLSKPAQPQYDLSKTEKSKRLDALYSAYSKIETLKSDLHSKNEQIYPVVKAYNKMIIYQQRIFSFSFTCIIFFLIGASLGSIIRKGGMGVPVVVAIVIFIIFYVMNLTVENFSWKGKLDPYMAAWLPNMILLPFGLWLTSKALTDSQVFDAEKYKAFFKPVTRLFVKQKEHARYQ